MCRYWTMWVEHGSPGNKHNYWNGLCNLSHVTRNRIACQFLSMALEFHTQYSELYESEEIIKCWPKSPHEEQIL